MAGIPAIPQNLSVQSGNQEILVSWDLSVGATSYLIQRSADNVTYSALATVTGSPLATSYLDSSATLGTQYWYKVAASNTSGTSPYTSPQSAVATPAGEMSLGQIRLAAQQRADRVNSQFVTEQEWNFFINQSMYELYDLLVTIFEDYFLAPPIAFTANGSQYQFDLPNGSNSFINPNTGQTFTPDPFYKLMGVDLALNNAQNAYVTINKFNFIDRNRFVYPNTASTIYGVFNLQYRVLGNQIEFIPTPSGGQIIRLWYIPRLTTLLQDTDTTTLSVSGWIQYVIIRAAKYALDKEESDTSKLDQELLFLKARIEESAANRDAGQPDKISNTRSGGWGQGWFSGNNGSSGGWAVAPIFMINNIMDHSLANSIFFTQSFLSYVFLFIAAAYFFNLLHSNFGRRIKTAFITISTLCNHICRIVFMSSKKQMIRINTSWIVTAVTHTQICRNWTYKKFIGYTRRNSRTSLKFKFPITISIFSTNPKPARLSFRHFVQKTLNRIANSVLITHKLIVAIIATGVN